MSRAILSTAVMGALVLLGTAGAAHAQAARKPAAALSDSNKNARDALTLDQTQTDARRTLQFDMPAKWGWKLEMNQPVTREMQLKDMEAGAYFKFTPSFRVGGAVGLADKPLPVAPRAQEQTAPRVRLETTFKF